MAYNVEPMDIDSEFDNKENSLHHNNVLPFTEKGYEELDVSELNIKLRYSLNSTTPMSKSYTANCLDNRSLESGDDSLNITSNENAGLTRSLNSTITKNDSIIKSLKALPLQTIQTEQFIDSNRTSILRPLESNISSENRNISVTVTAPNDADENLSISSSTSSALQTPEATTPTKDIPHKDGGSPIMRGLKSVFNMFRSSQSPIPPAETENDLKPVILSPDKNDVLIQEATLQHVLASTPISDHRKKELSPTKRISPVKDCSLVFNEDLEKELQWKDETTIIFSQERMPIHKLFLQHPQSNINLNEDQKEESNHFNSTTEYMDISCNDSIIDTTMTDLQTNNHKIDSTLAGESDSEFVDCETTLTKNEPKLEENCYKSLVPNKKDEDIVVEKISENKSGSRLKQIVLDTTQDILDATLSVRPEDLLPEKLEETIIEPALVLNNTDTIEFSKIILGEDNEVCHNIDRNGNAANYLPEETNTEILNSTSKLSEIFTVEPSNTTFDVTNMNIQNENATQTMNLETILNETQILDSKLTCTEVLNTDVINKTVGLDSTFAITAVVDFAQNIPDEVEDIENSHSELAVVNITDNLDTKSVESTPRFNDLPVDIPLPDEEDIEKVLQGKDFADANGTYVAQPLDLVDSIKIETKIADCVMEPPKENKVEENLSMSGKNVLLDNAKSVTEEENPSIVEKTVLLDNAEPVSEEENLTRDNKTVLIGNAEFVTENGYVNNKLGHMQQTIQGKDLENINTNQSISALPDIVNQTNLFTNMDNLECKAMSMNVEIIKSIEASVLVSDDAESEVLVSKEKDVVNSIHTHIITEDVLANVSTEKQEQKSGNLSAKESPIVPAVCTKLLDNVSNDDLTPFKANDLMQLLDDNKDTVKLEQFDAISTVKEKSISLEALEPMTGIAATKDIEEQLVLSENNSPYVSVTADHIVDNIENMKNPTDTDLSKNRVLVTPPNSPPIKSKGYNFNFDDMDCDPFATKANIQMSLPLDNIQKPDAVKEVFNSAAKPTMKKDSNRRKSQPDKRRHVVSKRKFNATIDSITTEKTEKAVEMLETIHLDSPVTVSLNQKNVTIEEDDTKICNTVDTNPDTVVVSDEILDTNLKNESKIKIEQNVVKSSIEINNANSDANFNTTSSSEQSTYFSAGTSSSDSSIPTRNVFNLPEIDDINFNPFATKCKMRQSPPPSLDIDSPLETNSKMRSSPDISLSMARQEIDNIDLFEGKLEAELMEKDVSGNISNTTVSSKATDEKNITTREIHSEDEDTIEGPFLEADDINIVDKISDFDDENIDMMHFNELPTRNNQENLGNGEMFIDAEAFEFLLNQNASNTVVDSGKESLFLKFDPLFAKRMSTITSDSVVASLAKPQVKQSTPSKETQQQSQVLASPTAGPSNLNVTRDLDMNISEDFNDELNITVSKPMMVVPPAVNPVTPRNKSITPNRSNRRSITFTSPAMAVIDRLLSLSGYNSQTLETSMIQESREQNEADIALSQLRELLAEKEIRVCSLRSESNELRDRLNTLESHVKTLEAEGQEKLQKINQLNQTLVEKTKINKSMAAVVEEYERTIASLVAETAQDKKRHAEERVKLINERDEQTAHLASMEVSFSDLHSKYEKSKQVILQLKANEDLYKKSIKDCEENFAKLQNNYELLKQHATSKLNHANQELEKINRSHEAEVLKLNAMIKRKDLHITSLEESLIQKTKANEELTAICDELISKVG